MTGTFGRLFDPGAELLPCKGCGHHGMQSLPFLIVNFGIVSAQIVP